MVIKNIQLEKMGLLMKAQFLQQANRYLKERFPSKIREITGQELKDKIVKGVEKAKAYNITDRMDVIHFLEFIVVYGDDFDIYPPAAIIKRYLKTHNFSGTEKMKKIQNLKLIKYE